MRPMHQMAASEVMEVPRVNKALKAATRIMMQIIAYSGLMLSITMLATILPICVLEAKSFRCADRAANPVS